MKTFLISLFLSVFISAPTFAAKPEWAGKGKPTAKQKEMYKGTRGGKADGIDFGRTEDKIKEGTSTKLKGLEKQRQKKSEQVQKELGKGSEKGQESREQRKKWWKFWGE